MKLLNNLLTCFLLLFMNCFFFNDDDPPPDPDPFVFITSNSDIIGEWVCYHTHIIWKDGKHDYYLDKEKKEDVIKIDSTRMYWKFINNGVYYEYSFPYRIKVLSDSSSYFCKDSAFYFSQHTAHHWGEPFGIYDSNESFSKWTVIWKNSTDLCFVMDYDIYSEESSFYTKKTW